MKLFFAHHSDRRSRWGMSLVELMVTTGIASIAFAAIASLSVYSARSFVAMGNYADLDQASRNTLDLMAREIRQTRALTNFSATKLVFLDIDNQTLTYQYNSADSTLTRKQGTGPAKILLQGCDFLNFHISQRNPSNNFTFFPTTNVSLAKMVDVSWRCSRKILGAKVNTESVQTAKIVIRN
jgi:type II secretory pathway pseudopilin PulG